MNETSHSTSILHSMGLFILSFKENKYSNGIFCMLYFFLLLHVLGQMSTCYSEEVCFMLYCLLKRIALSMYACYNGIEVWIGIKYCLLMCVSCIHFILSSSSPRLLKITCKVWWSHYSIQCRSLFMNDQILSSFCVYLSHSEK